MTEKDVVTPLYAVFLTDMYERDLKTLYTFNDPEIWAWLNKEEDFSKTNEEFNAEVAANKDSRVEIWRNKGSIVSSVPGTDKTIDLAIGYYRNEKAMYMGQLIDDGDPRVTEFIGTDQDMYALMSEIFGIMESSYL